MMKRQQLFHNWWSKLWLGCKTSDAFMLPCFAWPSRADQNGLELASAWKIALSSHVIRRLDYRGRSLAVTADRLRIPYDAMTTIGVLYVVT